MPKKIPTASYNGFTYDYDFIIKDLTEEFKKQFTCFNFLTYYNLLIVQDLWQASDKILSIIFLKEFMELNVITDMIIKKYETCGIKYKYCNCFLEHTNFKDDLIEDKCLCCNKNYQQKFDEKLKERF